MRRKTVVPLVSIITLALAALIAVLVTGQKPELGLDLQGGASVVLKPVGNYDSAAINQTAIVIRNRVDGLGVAEPEITRQGDNIVVSLPGVKDQNRALAAVGKTAELRFRPVLQVLPADESASGTDIEALQKQLVEARAAIDATSTTTAAPSTTAGVLDTASTTLAGGSGPGSARVPRQTDASTTSSVSTSVADTTTTATTAVGDTTTSSSIVVPTTTFATTQIEKDAADAIVVLPQRDKDGTVVARYQLGPAKLTGDGLKSAEVAFQQDGWGVDLELKSGETGLDKFNELAAECYAGADTCPTRQLAIVMDGVVESAPTVNQPSFNDGRVRISGSFTEAKANDLQLVLKYGALPVDLVPEAVQTVSATLGRDSLRAGVIAGLLGVALVLLFMLFYYRALALVVVVGIVLSGTILWSFISWQGNVLTLAGATGIIVSIGVTVDSYVVFFERLKDDVRGGKSLRSATTKGFAGAWRTILAADTVSLIAAVLLFWQTVGAVRGFAYYLGLSTLIDMIVAWFFTKNAVRLFAGTKWFSGTSVLGVRTGEAKKGVVA